MILEGGFLGGLAALVGAGLVAMLLWNLLVAFLVGALARFMLPGSDKVGWFTTILVGFLGGIVGNVLRFVVGMRQTGVIPNFLGSLVGALLLLVAHRVWVAKRGGSGAKA